jgi:4-hydroxybenzoate polyprenyltransferase
MTNPETAPPADPETAPPDSEHRGWIGGLPAMVRDYAVLARFDRPIGTWLLFWPCAWGLALAGGLPREWWLLIMLALGAVAMRGAGCVYNDIVDRDLDAQVERTRSRPLAAGRVTLRGAWIWLGLLCLVGLAVLLQLRPVAQIVALAALALVAAYPFMKRVTWWPQAWLGLTFNWGVLVAWAQATGGIDWPAAALYAAGIFWTLGYDTIYAVQDKEDDALAGIKSSARRLGDNARRGVGAFYGVAVLLLIAALVLRRPDALVIVALLPAAIHLAWQTGRLKPDDAAEALMLFRTNRFAGLLIFLACWVVGSA